MQAQKAAYDMINDLDIRKRVQHERGDLRCNVLLLNVLIEGGKDITSTQQKQAL